MRHTGESGVYLGVVRRVYGKRSSNAILFISIFKGYSTFVYLDTRMLPTYVDCGIAILIPLSGLLSEPWTQVASSPMHCTKKITKEGNPMSPLHLQLT